MGSKASAAPSKSTPPKYKLSYFNVKARAEMVRLMFAAAGVKYEDDRFSFEEWPSIKPKMPQLVAPILVVDGKTTIVQSQAIARYVARELRLYGKNNVEATQIDQITETLIDLVNAATPAVLEKDATKKAELMKKFVSEDAPKFLGYIDKLIGSFGKDGFAVSNSLSLADCAVHSLVDSLNLKELALGGKYPKLAACMKKVEENKNIAKWLKERPATQS